MIIIPIKKLVLILVKYYFGTAVGRMEKSNYRKCNLNFEILKEKNA